MLQSPTGGFPPWIDRYFLPVGGPLVVYYYLYRVRRAAAPLITAGRLTEEERSEFLRAVILYVTFFSVVPVVYGSIRAGTLPLSFTPFGPPPPISWSGELMLAVGLLLPLHWVWRGNGAELLAKMGPAFSHGMEAERWTPSWVRRIVTAIVVLSVGVHLARVTGMIPQ